MLFRSQFNDASQNIGAPSNAILDINATDEIELNATLVDINGNVEISGTATTTGVHTFTAVPVFPNNTVESADIQADAITGAKIADDAINSEHYTDGSIDEAHLANSAVNTAKIANSSITADKLAANCVDSSELINGSIDASHFAAGAVDATAIGNDVVNSQHYAAASIDNEHLADNAVDTAEIADNAVSLAKMAGGTDGNLITYDASGDPAYVATGSDGQVLTSTGAGSAPAFEALPASGKVLQLISVTKVDTFTYSGSTNFQNLTGLSAAITPSSSSNKVMIQVNLNLSSETRYAAAILKRGSTHVGGGTASSNRPSVSVSTASNPDNTNDEYVMNNSSFSFLDSPSTTSAVTYQVQVGNTNSDGATLYVNRNEDDSDANHSHRGSSTITLMEIAG